MNDTNYWQQRRAAEDAANINHARAHDHLAAELAAATAAGFTFRQCGGYTLPNGDYATYAAWSNAWHAAGCPSPC